VADLHQQRVLELARRNAQRYTFRYRSLLLHWLGRAFRRPAPSEVTPLPPVEEGQVAVTWGGHATALVRYHRSAVLCDPVLSRSVTGVRRERASGLALEALADVDLVLVTHAAPDHLDLPTLARLSRGATVVVPPRAGAQVSPLGFARLVELAPGSSLQHRGLEIIAETVQHGDRRSPAQSYVMRGEGPTVYYCAASGYFTGFADVGRRHWPDVALLPIGGYWPPSFRKRHMSPLDALYAFEDLRARVMVPIRYGTFALSYEQLNDPERWLAELVSERHLERFVVRLGAGETRVFVPPGVVGYDATRVDSAPDTGAVTSAAVVIARTRAAERPRPAAPAQSAAVTAAETPAPVAEPDDLTVTAGPSVVSPVPAAGQPRRPPALIIDHDEHDQDGETGVFDQPSGLRGRDGSSKVSPAPSEEDDDDDDESTRALILKASDSDPDAEPILAPGSR
jgi:L-ascorbate metabolism protein UlaG (beta-lactamase superfamily)